MVTILVFMLNIKFGQKAQQQDGYERKKCLCLCTVYNRYGYFCLPLSLTHAAASPVCMYES